MRRWIKKWKDLIFNNESEVVEMTDEELVIVERNLHWKSELSWDLPLVVKTMGTDCITIRSHCFVSAVKRWQRSEGLTEDGIIGPSTWSHILERNMTPKERAVRKIMEPTIGKESGGRYWALNQDGEFRGQFRNHRAEGKTHIGLSFGALQFTQDGGMLGRYLRECAKQNPDRFKSIMGPTWDKLLYITTRPGPSGLNSGVLRGPRVHKVDVIEDGVKVQRDIWEEPWASKFRRLGRAPEFQAVQRAMAERHYLAPILPNLREEGLVSEKLVAAAFSGSIHRGVGGMRSFIRRAIDSDEHNTEESILHEMVKRDASRFNSFVEDSTLSYDKWAGWAYF